MMQPLKCPSCGAAATLGPGEVVSTCKFCGTGMAAPALAGSGPSSANLMQLARAALEASNPDEAYGYFTRILETNPNDVESWLGKAEAAGRAGTLGNPRTPEVVAGVRQALAVTPNDQQPDVRRRGALVLTGSASNLFGASLGSLAEYAALDNAWPDHVGHALEALGVLAEARMLDASAPEPVIETIEICKSLLVGHRYFAEYEENPGWAVHRLAPQNQAAVQRTFAEAVEAMRRMDPTWVPPSITPARGASPAALIAVVAVLAVAIVGLLAWCAH